MNKTILSILSFFKKIFIYIVKFFKYIFTHIFTSSNNKNNKNYCQYCNKCEECPIMYKNKIINENEGLNSD